MLVLTVVDEMCFFFNFGTATNAWFDGLRGISHSRGCAMQLRSVKKAGGRQGPRHREAGRRNHGTATTRRTARKGRLTPCEMREPIPRGEPISTHLQRGSHATDAANKVPERQRTACPLGS